MAATDLVRKLYEAYQRRDWNGAAELLHLDATLDMPATRERLTSREEVIDFQRDYPEPWGDLTVLRVLGGADEACAEVEIVAAEHTFRLAAFWSAEDELLRDGIEYWVTVGGEQPPSGRAQTY
jgi:ketosteroid isomerase-like protein